MALNTYSALKTSIGSWLNRADLTDQIPDFIAMAEARFNREIRVNSMLQRDVTTATNDFLALPNDWLQHSSLVVTSPSDHGVALDYITPEEFNDRRKHVLPGIPSAYTIINNTILLLPAPSSNASLELTYYRKIPALSDSNTTNWLLQRSPDLYLYGSLMNAEPYLMNDERVPLWTVAVTQAIEAMKMESERASKPSGALVARRRTFG